MSKRIGIAIDPGVNAVGVALIEKDDLHTRVAWSGLVGWTDHTQGPSELGARAQMLGHITRYVLLSRMELGHIVTIWIETPRVYQAAQQKGDQNDLIRLTATGFTVAGTVANALTNLEAPLMVSVSPRDWKGTVECDAMAERIKGMLCEVDRPELVLYGPSDRRDCPAKLRHNIYDAIGLGLWGATEHWGASRWQKRRVYAR